MRLKKLISITNLNFRYKTKAVLSWINACIRSGDFITLLGPNGVGKSTLLNCITGLLRVEKGTISLYDNDITLLSTKLIAQTVAYVPQTIQANFDYTVREYALMGRTTHMNMFEMPGKQDYDIADEALDKLGILHLQANSFNQISVGEQQQVCIARALAQQPKLIILDEPTSALDFDNQIKVLNLIKRLAELGYAVLVTTHNPEHSLLLNSTVWLLDRNGSMAVGTAEEMINEKTLCDLYTSEIRVSQISSDGRKICYVSKL